MTAASPTKSITPPSKTNHREFRVDSLAIGMIVMLAMTILGRGIGFIRGMAFCRLMDDTDVGRWSMAFGFLTLITPVMLLGIPGVLPKFTEHFRLKGQLQTFVRRIAIGTLACTLAIVLAMLAVPSWFGYAIFLQSESQGLIYSVAAAVAAMILYNFVSDLNGSLRQVRVVSIMQFTHGVGFTVLSMIWLLGGGQFIGIVWMFTAACVAATIPGSLSLRRTWDAAIQMPADGSESSNELSDKDEGKDKGKDEDEGKDEPSNDTSAMGSGSSDLRMWSMVKRLAPYAFALWMTNLIGNLFELTDRYMILHLMPIPEEVAGLVTQPVREMIGQAAVGQYHSGRIIPTMLLSVGMMIAGVLMPYLSTDWESKRFDSVRARVGDIMMALSVLFTLGSAFAILIGPFMFNTLLQGRYTDGLQLMPMALCFCTWNSLVMIGQCYLLTAEKGRMIALAMFAGLIANLVLNAVLLPSFGLTGAVVATMLAHAVAMAGVWLAMLVCGYRNYRELVIISALPMTLLISPYVAIFITLVLAYGIWRNEAKRVRIVECLPQRLRSMLSS